jgi:hypothetical protein
MRLSREADERKREWTTRENGLLLRLADKEALLTASEKQNFSLEASVEKGEEELKLLKDAIAKERQLYAKTVLNPDRI